MNIVNGYELHNENSKLSTSPTYAHFVIYTIHTSPLFKRNANFSIPIAKVPMLCMLRTPHPYLSLQIQSSSMHQKRNLYYQNKIETWACF